MCLGGCLTVRSEEHVEHCVAGRGNVQHSVDGEGECLCVVGGNV